MRKKTGKQSSKHSRLCTLVPKGTRWTQALEKQSAHEILEERFFRLIGEDNRKSVKLLQEKFGFQPSQLASEDLAAIQQANDNVIKFLLESGNVSQELYDRFKDVERICQKKEGFFTK